MANRVEVTLTDYQLKELGELAREMRIDGGTAGVLKYLALNAILDKNLPSAVASSPNTYRNPAAVATLEKV